MTRIERRVRLFTALPVGTRMTVVLIPADESVASDPWEMDKARRVAGVFAGLVDASLSQPKLTIRAADRHGEEQQLSFALGSVDTVEDLLPPAKLHMS